MRQTVIDLNKCSLLDKRNLFVRKFRWTLETDTLNSTFVQGLKIDYVKNTIKFKVYEVLQKDVPGINAHNYRKEASSERLVLKAYAGDGKAIYTHTFWGLKLVKCKEEFDYTSNDVQIIQFKFEFQGSDLIAHKRIEKTSLEVSKIIKKKLVKASKTDKVAKTIKKFYKPVTKLISD